MKKTLLSMFFAACASFLLAQASVTPLTSTFQNGEPLVFNYTGGTGAATDWVGVYPIGEVPDGDPASSTWKYITTPDGQITLDGAFAPLENGDYSVHLFCCDEYTILASANFTVAGATPAAIETTSFAKVGSDLTFAYSGGTGSPTDWIGVYLPGQVPGTDQSIIYLYVTSVEGTATFTAPTLAAGDYVANFFCCDGYDVIATTPFTVYENTAPSLTSIGTIDINQPVKFAYTGGTGSFTDWVGIYKAGETPGAAGVTSVTYLYVGGVNGEVSFDQTALTPGTAYDAHFLCCDGYDIIASVLNFNFGMVGTNEATNQLSAFNVAPNPAKEFVNINFSEPVYGQFTLLNMTGQAVRSLAVNGENALELRNLAVGAYIGQFKSDKGMQTMKIVVE
jgi:hypothetical protein